MEESNDISLTNLRLIASIKEGEYITTDSGGNVINAFENTYTNSFLSSLLFENWNATKLCLGNLYTKQLPKLISRLIEDDEDLELTILCVLIEDSLKGVDHIKKVYNYNRQYNAWIESIIECYANLQISKIKNYLQDDDHELELKRGGIEFSPGENED